MTEQEHTIIFHPEEDGTFTIMRGLLPNQGVTLSAEELLALSDELEYWRWKLTGNSYSPAAQVRIHNEAIEADLETIATDEDAYAFIQKYFSQDLQGNYLKLYHSSRDEMNRTPRQAIDNLLSLPPIQ